MVYQLGAFGRIVGKRALYVYLGKRIVSLYKEYPGIRIEICRIVRFQFDCQCTHPFRLFQIFLFQREEIGVIIEDDHVLVVVLQRFIIRFIGFRHILDLIVDIAYLSVKSDFNPTFVSGIISRPALYVSSAS